ncbi:MAG: response regulator [Candidatus Latescibacteria bacterium]|nr:response regulator [Candidatus Latescibacterota bacterium]
MTDKARILVVDDTPSIVKALRLQLTAEGYEVLAAANGPEALALAAQDDPDLVLLDVMMPGMDGYEVSRRLKKRQGTNFVPIIMVTARTETESVVQGLESGADEYLTKPFDTVELSARIKTMLRIRRMFQENTRLRRELDQRHGFEQIVGESSAMAEIFALLPKVSQRAVTVLLTGETGTGKGQIARAIHYNGPRASEPFIELNCGALAENLLESELFGHRKGAFTGADEDRIGHFEAAGEGTLFLDEIGETSPAMQVKLLRVLQEGEFTPVGESQPRLTQARVLAATNRNLEKQVQAGQFREDLYYRLNVFPIHLPLLRERRQDIPLLAGHLLAKLAAKSGEETAGFTPEAMDRLSGYDWPGNVRELENEIERALILTAPGQAIGPEALSPKLRQSEGSPLQDGTLKEGIAALERQMIQRAWKTCNGHRTRMANQLQISRWTLLQKMKLYQIDQGEENG